MLSQNVLIWANESSGQIKYFPITHLWWHDLHLKSNNLYDEETYPAWDSPLPTRLASNVNVKADLRPAIGEH